MWILMLALPPLLAKRVLESLLLGALGLVLGQRADTKCLGKKDAKCSIKAEFSIQDYSLDKFFAQNDLDFFSNHS